MMGYWPLWSHFPKKREKRGREGMFPVGLCCVKERTRARKEEEEEEEEDKSGKRAEKLLEWKEFHQNKSTQKPRCKPFPATASAAEATVGATTDPTDAAAAYGRLSTLIRNYASATNIDSHPQPRRRMSPRFLPQSRGKGVRSFVSSSTVTLNHLQS